MAAENPCVDILHYHVTRSYDRSNLANVYMYLLLLLHLDAQTF